jgi:tripartite-type tricarboxylate transporter receptor subunit TctC
MRIFAAALAALLGIAGGTTAQAADYPVRPIRMIVGYGAGGSTDLAARVVAAHMEKTLGQPVLVENRTGGNGAVGTSAVFNSPPDGYTLAMTSGSILTVMPWSVDIGFDPLTMSFIGSTHESLYAQFVKGDAPWKTIQEMVAYAKSNPNKLVFTNSGGFGLPDISMAQLARAAGGFTYRTLPTTGGAEQVVKLLAGDAQTTPNSAAPTMAHYRTNSLRALMILSPAWPELEKMGVPLSKDVYGFSVRNLAAIVGPPGLPEDIRQKLEGALRKAMGDKDVLVQMEKVGELIRFRTGKQTHDDAVQVQAEQKIVGEQLGKLLKK